MESYQEACERAWKVCVSTADMKSLQTGKVGRRRSSAQEAVAESVMVVCWGSSAGPSCLASLSAGESPSEAGAGGVQGTVEGAAAAAALRRRPTRRRQYTTPASAPRATSTPQLMNTAISTAAHFGRPPLSELSVALAGLLATPPTGAEGGAGLGGGIAGLGGGRAGGGSTSTLPSCRQRPWVCRAP